MTEGRPGSTLRRCALAALTTLALSPALAQEVWVLTEESRELHIIDATTKTAVGVISLPAGSGTPTGLTFSTVGSGGTHAFVTEGSLLYRFDTATRTFVDSVDVSAIVGIPLTLEDCASAPTREFSAGPGSAPENHLYLAATADPGAGTALEPYYVILDQQELLAGAGVSPLLDSGPLNPPGTPPGSEGQVSGVSVLGAPDGIRHEQAWYTIQVGTPPSAVRSVLIATDSASGTPWENVRNEETVLPPGASTAAPGIATPYDRPMPLIPIGSALVPLDDRAGESCDLGGELRSALITGPAPGAYNTYVIDGSTSQLLRVNDEDCATEGFPLGDDPVDLTAVAPFTRGEVFVVNRGSDSVSVLCLDDTMMTIELEPPAPACVLCPIKAVALDLEAQRCNLSNVSMNQVFSDAGPIKDTRLQWSGFNCPTIGVYCQCLPYSGEDDCPCECDPQTDGNCFWTAPPTASFLSGGGPFIFSAPKTPWIHLGNTVTNSFTHLNVGNYGGNLTYVLGPPPTSQ